MIRACFFDVFGTVVDWHTSVSRDLAEFAEERDVTGVDWVEFAEEWRKLYNPAMEEVRSGRRDWTILDVLHREGLMTLLDRYDLDGFDEGEIDRDEPRVAPARPVARLGARAAPAEDAVRDRAVFEREHRPDREHGEARGAAVGRRARSRAGACATSRNRRHTWRRAGCSISRPRRC